MIYFEFFLVVIYWLNLRDLSLYCIFWEYFFIVILNFYYMKKIFLLFSFFDFCILSFGIEYLFYVNL